MLHAEFIDEALLAFTEHLLRQLVKVPEDPEEVNALGEGESNVSRTDWGDNAHHAVSKFVEHHTGPTWDLISNAPEYNESATLLHRF